MSRKKLSIAIVALLTLGVSTCSTPTSGPAPAATGAPGSPATPAAQAGTGKTLGPNLATAGMDPIAGQQATCAGARQKTFNLTVTETAVIELGISTTFNAWTYNGRIPGPTLEVCQGDEVTIHVFNKGTTSHGLDTHAFKIDARKYGPTPPETVLTIQKTVDTPGVFMYHCAAGPVTDLHIKSGIHGAMIVYPRNEQFRPAREIVIIRDAIFGERDPKTGNIPGTDPGRAQRNDPTFFTFNGNLAHSPVKVVPGDLVRAYVVNVGPGAAALHVIGTVIERVYDGATRIDGVQTYNVPPGGGAILEFPIPEAGVFPFVDHDRLAYLPLGFVLGFAADVQAGPVSH